MSSTTFVEILAVFASSLLIVVAVWVLTRRSPRDPTPESAGNPDDEPVKFLFDSIALVDSTPAASKLMDQADSQLNDWDGFRSIFSSRFADLPGSLSAAFERGNCVYSCSVATDPARIEQHVSGHSMRLEPKDPGRQIVQQHLLFLYRRRVQSVQRTTNAAPYPIWVTNPAGEIMWSNSAYRKIAATLKNLEDLPRNPPLFTTEQLSDLQPETPARLSVQSAQDGQLCWFDVTMIEDRNLRTFFASDVSAVVKAEMSQRNFVQTLTKTFAHLSIGLAIFDRNRQLALFNPALIDLTSISAELLSARPNLMTFFDHLREKRVMPEPKNYASWREQLTEVVIAASDGRYAETWTLPSGLTYRVTGRPHPDGAIAFLFEDISAEISLTRRFREELEIGHSVIDSLDDAVAVFSNLGTLTFSNAAYARMWNVNTDITLQEISIIDATRVWQIPCSPTPIWGDLRDYVVTFAERAAWEASVDLEQGGRLECSVTPLIGGATLVRFSSGDAELPLVTPDQTQQREAATA